MFQPSISLTFLIHQRGVLDFRGKKERERRKGKIIKRKHEERLDRNNYKGQRKEYIQDSTSDDEGRAILFSVRHM